MNVVLLLRYWYLLRVLKEDECENMNDLVDRHILITIQLNQITCFLSIHQNN